jgi:hypothetical protein
MKITLKIKDNIIEFKNVWEIQDNGQAELVIKHYDYSCKRFKENEISSINVELENKDEEFLKN